MRRTFLACLASIAFLSAAAPPVPAPVAAPAPGPLAPRGEWVPLTRPASGLLFVPAQVNGRPVTAFIDTGTAAVIVSRRLADALGKAVVASGEAVSVGGKQSFGRASGFRLTLGGIHFPEAAMLVSDFSRPEAVAGVPIDIVIGSSLLATFPVEFDLDHGRMRLGGPVDAGEGALSVPLRYDRTTRRLSVAGTLGATRLAPILVDTGADGGLTLSDEVLRQMKGQARTATTFLVVGGGGSEVESVVNFDSLQVGPLSMRPVQARVSARDTMLTRAGMAASVGMEVLGRHNFVLDAPSGRLLLRPRAAPPPTPPRSTIGVQADYRTDRIVVLHVMANSPAEKVGLKAGDEICAVNGQKVVDGWTHSPMRNWGTRPPGQAYVLNLCSGRELRLVSAAFY